MRHLSTAAVCLTLSVAPAVALQSADSDVSWRIRREATEHSQVMQTLHVLTDVYGPRLTGSPNVKAAGEWASEWMTGWGMKNARGFAPSLYHAEPIPGESKPFADRANGVHYYENLVVLHSASQPAVLLEAGVIVNRAEELALRDPATRRLIAAAAAEGVRRCLRARAL